MSDERWGRSLARRLAPHYMLMRRLGCDNQRKENSVKIRATEQQVKQMFANAYQAASGLSIDPEEFHFSKQFDGKRKLNIATWVGVGVFLNATQITPELYEMTPDEPRELEHPWAATYPTMSDLATSAGAQVTQ